jgi:ubiquinone/menaquinone biosynthesis C-methylase UbiE
VHSTGTPHAEESDAKEAVRAFWQEASCGESYAEGETLQQALTRHAVVRSRLEPYISAFADFASARGHDILEIGVGMGADHVEFARQQPRSLAGLDLTQRAIDYTRARLQFSGLSSDLRCDDAERLPFPDATFDLVYSWGVLHHSPRTDVAVEEVRRVLRPGGTAKIMIYHRRSLVGAMLWLRYGVLTGHPRRSWSALFATHLESPGTKAYTRTEARQLFGRFARVRLDTQLSPGDLLASTVGDRHPTSGLAMAKRLWPRPLVSMLGRRAGLYLLITATK